MKILNINLNFHVSTLYQKMAEEMINQGCSFNIYYPTENRVKIKLPYLQQDNILNKLDRYLFRTRANKIIKRLISKENIHSYDVIHAHSLFSNGYIAYKLKQKYKIPYIVAVRNTDINLYFKKIKTKKHLGIKILESASKIILISYAYKKKLLKYIPKKLKQSIIDKIEVIPNGIDEFWLENSTKEFKTLTSKKEINLLYVGKINKNKNLLLPINVCKKFIKNGFKIRYTFIGETLDKKVLRKITKESFCKYIPFIEKQQLIDYYRKNDIFIMLSKNETFGLSYIEALSQGTPILYTKGQGVDGFFENKSVGCSIQYGNEKELENGLKYIIDNYEKLSKNALDICRLFSWKNICKKYIEIYKSIK